MPKNINLPLRRIDDTKKLDKVRVDKNNNQDKATAEEILANKTKNEDLQKFFDSQKSELDSLQTQLDEDEKLTDQSQKLTEEMKQEINQKITKIKDEIANKIKEDINLSFYVKSIPLQDENWNEVKKDVIYIHNEWGTDYYWEIVDTKQDFEKNILDKVEQSYRDIYEFVWEQDLQLKMEEDATKHVIQDDLKWLKDVAEKNTQSEASETQEKESEMDKQWVTFLTQIWDWFRKFNEKSASKQELVMFNWAKKFLGFIWSLPMATTFLGFMWLWNTVAKFQELNEEFWIIPENKEAFNTDISIPADYAETVKKYGFNLEKWYFPEANLTQIEEYVALHGIEERHAIDHDAFDKEARKFPINLSTIKDQIAPMVKDIAKERRLSTEDSQVLLATMLFDFAKNDPYTLSSNCPWSNFYEMQQKDRSWPTINVDWKTVPYFPNWNFWLLYAWERTEIMEGTTFEEKVKELSLIDENDMPILEKILIEQFWYDENDIKTNNVMQK